MLQRLLVLLFALTVLSMSADAAKRVALIIGNAKYTHFSTLANPDNDATAIAEALRDAKFDEVTLATDLDFNGLKKALKNFSSRSVGAEVALVYYAGHGVEVDGINYLVPIEAELLRATDVEFEAIPLDLARTAVSSASKLRMVILDACRNNPFKLVKADGTRAGRTRGLRAIETKASEFIAYSAKEGTTANDGPADGNSPFATALVSAIKQPGLEVRLMFGKVRDDVLEATNKEQEPFTYTSLGGDSIYLNPVPIVPKEKIASPPVPTNPSIDVAWQAVKQSGNKQALEGFVAFYTKDPLFGLYGPLVQQALLELTAKPKAASLEPPKLPEPTPAISNLPQVLDPVLVSAVQSELKRVACYNGKSDGKWGPAALAAAAKFNALIETKLSKLDPSTELLTALQDAPDRFCVPTVAKENVKRTPPRVKKVQPAAKIVSRTVAPKTIVQPERKKATRTTRVVTKAPTPTKSIAKKRPGRNILGLCPGPPVGGSGTVGC